MLRLGIVSNQKADVPVEVNGSDQSVHSQNSVSNFTASVLQKGF